MFPHLDRDDGARLRAVFEGRGVPLGDAVFDIERARELDAITRSLLSEVV